MRSKILTNSGSDLQNHSRSLIMASFSMLQSTVWTECW